MTLKPDSLVPRAAVDIFIGGYFDRSSCIVSAYRVNFRQNYPDHTTFYFEHDQHSEIISAVMTAKTGNAVGSLNLVGHSWGALTAIEVANTLAATGLIVDQVITIDPVARKRLSVLANGTTWINVNAAPATSNGWNGDYWATLGGKWGDWPRGKARVHYWAPFHHNEFASLLEYVALDGDCALNYLCGSGRAET